jgi:hypothetical protein
VIVPLFWLGSWVGIHSQQTVSEIEHALGFVGEELRGYLVEAVAALETKQAMRSTAMCLEAKSGDSKMGQRSDCQFRPLI